MKKLLVITLIFFCCITAHAAVYNIVSGYGYLTDKNGHITAYEILTPGTNVTINDAYNYTEVPDQQSMISIPLYQQPLNADVQTDILIAQDEKNLAIADLQNKGLINAQQAQSAKASL